MKKLATWITTVLLLGAWTSTASANGLWATEISTWVIRWYIMQMGGNWR